MLAIITLPRISTGFERLWRLVVELNEEINAEGREPEHAAEVPEEDEVVHEVG